jgi:integrase
MTYRNYLIKNTPTSSYLFRIKIPKDLRYYFNGKIGFTMSLKNGIYSQSIVFAKILHLEVESIFNSIRMGTMSKIDINQIKDILKDKIDRTLTHTQWVVADTNTFVESEVKKRIEEINTEERNLQSQIEQDYDVVLEHIEKEIERTLKKKDLTLDSKSLEFTQLRKQFLELRLIRNTWKKEMLEGSGKSIEDFRKEIYTKFNIKDEPTDLDLLSKLQSSESILGSRVIKDSVIQEPPKKDDSPKLSEMKDDFLGERLLSGFSPKSTREIGSTIDDFIEIVGDIQISQVIPKDAREFKRIISLLPKHRHQSPRYRGLNIKQILGLKNVEGQEPKNINKLIYRVRIFSRWLRNNYREYVPQNYFEGLSVQSKKITRPRQGFSNEELIQIFDPVSYLGYTIRNLKRRTKLSSFFVPLIGLYTGMRLEEICQLRLKDVSTSGDYDVFKVVISEDTKLKNIQSERIIPIHQNLKNLGFLDYCKYLRKLKYERVFYDLEKNRDGYGRNMGRFFMDYLKKIEIYQFQSKVFHSLRHTFITNLLQNGVREELVNGLDGHQQKTMSTTIYFKGGFPADVLYEEGISKLNYEGLDLEELKINWKKYI